MNTIKFCAKCGAPIGPEEKFCGGCGASVAEMEAEAGISTRRQHLLRHPFSRLSLYSSRLLSMTSSMHNQQTTTLRQQLLRLQSQILLLSLANG